MSFWKKVKSWFNVIGDKIQDFWHSGKVTELRHDFQDFIIEVGEKTYNEILLPFVKQQIKNYAGKVLKGEIKHSEIKNLVKQNFKDIHFKDYIIDTLIQDTFFDLKVTMKI